MRELLSKFLLQKCAYLITELNVCLQLQHDNWKMNISVRIYLVHLTVTSGPRLIKYTLNLI